MEQQAVLRTGGKQYLVKKGGEVEIEKLDVEEGGQVVFDDVLLWVGAGGAVKLDPAELARAKVYGRVAAVFKDDKKIGLKYKPKKRYRRKYGHRQELMRVKITKIES